MCTCGVYLSVTLLLVSVIIVVLLATPTPGYQVGRRERMEKHRRVEKDEDEDRHMAEKKEAKRVSKERER